MSRLPLKHPHIDYNPHVLHDEEDYTWDVVPNPKDMEQSMDRDAFLMGVIEDLRKENKFLHNCIRELEQEITSLRRYNSDLHWLDPNNI